VKPLKNSVIFGLIIVMGCSLTYWKNLKFELTEVVIFSQAFQSNFI